jgi:hypothetical protein
LRFDILVTSSALSTQFSADVTVVNPISSSPVLLSQHAARSGQACASAEARKQAQYAQASTDLGYDFIPFAMEVFGRLGQQGTALLKTLASRVVSERAEVDLITSNKLHASLIHLWRIQLSSILQKGNAKAINMGLLHNAQQSQRFSQQRPIDLNALREAFNQH